LYCDCEGGEERCAKACEPVRAGPTDGGSICPSSAAGACEACYVDLARCENGRCQSECMGQPFHDAGVASDANGAPDSGDAAESGSAEAAGDP
jgi:hypothetical protein